MVKYKIPKGVFDILPKDPDPEGQWRNSYLWQYVEGQMRKIAHEYGFREIRTPVFESTELFTRSIGASSDIVSKEMYTFHDKGDRSLTLRPEGTAPAMRAFIENHLDQHAPVHKLFYLFSMFRYERQQAGRFRQHHQFGVETIGIKSPHQDVEVIHLLWTLYDRLGLKGLTLHLNSIGDEEARKAFRHQLKEYLRPHFNDLSPESQQRYETNPLRILDSKNQRDQSLLIEAPKVLDFLNPESHEHFKMVCSLLEKIGIPYQINHKLVRGLDYYNNTVFEITSNELGSQNSLGGGGRYDGLLKELGGADLPAFGFGAGIERIIQTMLAQKVFLPQPPHCQIFFIPLGPEAKQHCFDLVCQLRKVHVAAEMDLADKKLKNAMKYADSIQAKYVTVIGEDELKTQKIELKEMATGKTESIQIDSLEQRLLYEL